jgi:hypothetical protein
VLVTELPSKLEGRCVRAQMVVDPHGGAPL